MSKFEVGDRVRASHSYFSRHGDGTVIPATSAAWIRVKHDDGYEDGYYEDTLELITKGGARMARKTYKLIKDTPTVKKGAIYQEACDDGTQEYIILDQGFIKDVDGKGQAPIYTRSLVEDAPNFFVEVFPVEPQFMTAPELEQWEAFKAKAVRTVAKKPLAIAAKSSWTPERRAAQSKKIKAAWAAKKAA